jgi:hypothetical protein
MNVKIERFAADHVKPEPRFELIGSEGLSLSFRASRF